MNELKVGLFAGAIAVALGASPAMSQAGVNSVQCVIVATVHSRAGNENQKRIAVLAEAFYLGRLTGSTEQLQAEFARQVKTITSQNNGEIMNQCARAMNSKIEEVKGIQQALARAQKR